MDNWTKKLPGKAEGVVCFLAAMGGSRGVSDRATCFHGTVLGRTIGDLRAHPRPGLRIMPSAPRDFFSPFPQEFRPGLFEREVVVKDEIGSWIEQAAGLGSAGAAARSTGDERAAEAHFRQALDLALKAVRRTAEASPHPARLDVLLMAVRLALNCGEVSEARRLMENALEADSRNQVAFGRRGARPCAHKRTVNHTMTVEQLLRWRLAQAETEAPPAPRGTRLLDLARPWWESWPERFQTLVERLSQIQIAYGHAMTDPRRSPGGYPVPALIVRPAEELETSVRVLYFAVRDGWLRLRFHLGGMPGPTQASFDVTFVADQPARALLSAQATLSMESEYRIDAELADELARDWASLKVTDRMSFRLILRAAVDDDQGPIETQRGETNK